MIQKSLKAGLIILSMISPLLASGQMVELSGTDNHIEVSGTSTLHDWEMELSTFKSTAQLKTDDAGKYIEDASFTANANDLTSDNSIMDNKAHDALKAEDHPEISFQQTGIIKVAGNDSESLKLKGNLKIAGKTNPVEITISIKVSQDRMITVRGETTIKMTDFNMKPPTAMFGTIKADDEVTVKFNLNLK